MARAPEPLCSDLAWLLDRASHAVTNELAAALEREGLSPRMRCVLTTAMQGELTQIEIARAVGLDKTTMVVTLDELERRGLAERRPSSTDRRARVIVVTKAGEKLVREANKIIARVQEDVLGALPGAQRRALVDGLVTLVSGRLAEPSECAKPVRRRRAA